MDIMDIQAVESKLSDVTVTPIPRSQVQNFYNYQQQREQREQQPQIQISAIHHAPQRERHHNSSNSNNYNSSGSNKRSSAIDRNVDYQQQSSSSSSQFASAAAAVAALQYTQQLQAQLALLQQQANSPAASAAIAAAAARLNSAGLMGAANSTTTPPLSIQLKQPKEELLPLPLNMPSPTAPETTITPVSAMPVTADLPALSPIITTQISSNITTPMTSTANLPSASLSSSNNGLSKYAQLLAVIEEMGRDIRPTYTGSRSSTERLKRGIVHARILVRECLMETDRSGRQ